MHDNSIELARAVHKILTVCRPESGRAYGVRSLSKGDLELRGSTLDWGTMALSVRLDGAPVFEAIYDSNEDIYRVTRHNPGPWQREISELVLDAGRIAQRREDATAAIVHTQRTMADLENQVRWAAVSEVDALHERLRGLQAMLRSLEADRDKIWLEGTYVSGGD